ncbi:hypothetical protein BGW36DRAFT_426473 [Talaromyces proteolyticus]|uniref:Uncharacterized protein n=1 Tax=Talaromyces proteolyticus TaxID=1131652 RepID=A0AAD4KUR1_9EURO|nr:uncharacterized protein BGW36DRAFT_426473 [Talaromyces proteolyticus]KAH8698784.1 hypothetical protein BGW36DRAFT_426473 [Talaromyces proteolyticus]
MSGASTLSPFSPHPARTRPKGVKKARLKHQNRAVQPEDQPQNTEKEATLFDRFLCLPGEIRNRVYRMLLVQPCKFDMFHGEGCRKLVVGDGPGPRFEDEMTQNSYRCAECTYFYYTDWRHSVKPVYVSPIRSKWGSQTLPNEFLCDLCWHRKFGNIDRPSMETLPCLCTRRLNLQVMLINRRVYKEASYIFWTENHFAFENPSLLKGFLLNIRPEARDLLTRISLMAHHDYDPPPSEVVEKMLNWKDVEPLWGLLRACDGLVELELDAEFLSKKGYILGMRRLRSRRFVTFVDHAGATEVDMVHRGAPQEGESRFIWPALAFRKPVDRGYKELAEELAASIVKDLPLSPRYLRALHNKAQGRKFGKP